MVEVTVEVRSGLLFRLQLGSGSELSLLLQIGLRIQLRIQLRLRDGHGWTFSREMLGLDLDTFLQQG